MHSIVSKSVNFIFFVKYSFVLFKFSELAKKWQDLGDIKRFIDTVDRPGGPSLKDFAVVFTYFMF